EPPVGATTLTSPLGELAYDFRVYGAICGQQGGIHPDQFAFEFGGIHDQTTPYNLAGPGDLGERSAHHPRGERFGRGHSLPSINQSGDDVRGTIPHRSATALSPARNRTARTT